MAVGGALYASPDLDLYGVRVQHALAEVGRC